MQKNHTRSVLTVLIAGLLLLFISCNSIPSNNLAHAGTESYYISKPILNKDTPAGVKIDTQIMGQVNTNPLQTDDDFNLGLDAGLFQIMAVTNDAPCLQSIALLLHWGIAGYGGYYRNTKDLFYQGINALCGVGCTWDWGVLDFYFGMRMQYLAEFGSYHSFLLQFLADQSETGLHDYAGIFEMLVEEELKYSIDKNNALGADALGGIKITTSHTEYSCLYFSWVINLFFDTGRHSFVLGNGYNISFDIFLGDNIDPAFYFQYLYKF